MKDDIEILGIYAERYGEPGELCVRFMYKGEERGWCIWKHDMRDGRLPDELEVFARPRKYIGIYEGGFDVSIWDWGAGYDETYGVVRDE